ncbi:MAG: hypothetical protein J0M12_17000 [Deltaproteobacteria bacterium]|nr:hypothetical protein [Deltaproteobacteria bacterium]
MRLSGLAAVAAGASLTLGGCGDPTPDDAKKTGAAETSLVDSTLPAQESPRVDNAGSPNLVSLSHDAREALQGVLNYCGQELRAIQLDGGPEQAGVAETRLRTIDRYVLELAERESLTAIQRDEIFDAVELAFDLRIRGLQRDLADESVRRRALSSQVDASGESALEGKLAEVSAQLSTARLIHSELPSESPRTSNSSPSVEISPERAERLLRVVDQGIESAERLAPIDFASSRVARAEALNRMKDARTALVLEVMTPEAFAGVEVALAVSRVEVVKIIDLSTATLRVSGEVLADEATDLSESSRREILLRLDRDSRELSVAMRRASEFERECTDAVQLARLSP